MNTRGYRLIAIPALLSFSLLLMALPVEVPQAAQRRIIPMVALDSSGLPVPGITAGRIRILDIAAKVTRVGRAPVSRRIVLLFDVSGSMRTTKTRLQNTVQTAKEFLKNLEPTDLVSLQAFKEKPQVLVPFTRNMELISEKIDVLGAQKLDDIRKQYGAEAGHRIVTTLELSLACAGPELRFGDAIVLISDGLYFRASAREFQKMQATLIRLGVRTFLLQTTELIQKEGIVQPSVRLIKKELIDEVGGTAICPHERPDGEFPIYESEFKAKEMTDASKLLTRMIHDLYEVEIEVEAPVQKPRRFTLKLLDPMGKKMEKVKLLYPRWVVPRPETSESK